MVTIVHFLRLAPRAASGLNPAPSQTQVSLNSPAEKTMMFRMLIGLAVAAPVDGFRPRPAARAPSRLDDIIKRGTLRVGMTGDYLPFTSSRQGDVDIQRLRRRHGGGAGQGARRQGGVRADRLAAADEGFRGRQFRYRDGRRIDHARPAEEGPVLDADHARGQDADRALRRQGQIRDASPISTSRARA